GPGYAPQYLYWFLPLLITTFVMFKKNWQIASANFFIIAALTYSIEYALLPSHGMFLLRILANESSQPPSWLPLIQKLPTAEGQTLLRFPLFVAYLFLFAVGMAILLRGMKNSPRKN